MRILVDGKALAELSAEQEKDVRRFRAEESVQGEVLSADEATTAYGGQTRLVLTILWGAAAVVAAVIASLAEPADQAIVLPAAALIIAALGAFFAFMLWRRRRDWRRDLPRRLEGMAPAGSPIRVDATGVTVAGRTMPWQTLAIDQVEFSRYGTRRAIILTLERLTLAGPEGRVVLDPVLMRNGHLIVGNAWRRMRAGRAAT